MAGAVKVTSPVKLPAEKAKLLAAEVVLAAWKPKPMPDGEVVISTAGGVLELVTIKSSTVQRLADELVEL
ncbi:hypothetical protein D3C73_1479230 [compost metagenome]